MISQSLSLSIPVITQWTHEQSAKVAGVEVFHGLTNMDFHSPSEYSIVECQSASSRDQYWISNMASFFRLVSQLPGGRFIALNHLYFGGGRVLLLLELTFTLYTDLPSIHTVPLPKLPSVDSQNISINMVFHRKLFLIKKKLILYQMKCGKGLRLMEFTGLTISSWLDKIVSWRHSDLGSHPAAVRWKYLQGLGQSSLLNYHSILWFCFFYTIIHRSKNQGVEMKVATFTVTPIDPLEKFLLPEPMTLHFAGLEVLVPEE